MAVKSAVIPPNVQNVLDDVPGSLRDGVGSTLLPPGGSDFRNSGEEGPTTEFPFGGRVPIEGGGSTITPLFDVVDCDGGGGTVCRPPFGGPTTTA